MQLLLIKNSGLERGNTIHDPITVEQYYCTLALICKNHLFHSYSSQCCCLIHLEILGEIFLIREDTQIYMLHIQTLIYAHAWSN